MTQYSVDFSTLPVTDPSVPPAGLSLWGRSTINGKIIASGFTRSGSGTIDNTRPPAWLVTNALDTKHDIVKAEITVGLADATATPNGAFNTGIIFVNGNGFSTVGFIRSSIRCTTYNGNGTTQSTSMARFTSSDPLIVPGDKITAYYRKSTKEIIVALNGKFVPYTQTFITYDNAQDLYVGVLAHNTSASIKTLSVDDHNARPEPIAFKPRNDWVTLPLANGVYSGRGENKINCLGFTPEGGDINGVPITISSFVNNVLQFSTISWADLAGSVFPYDPIQSFNSNILTLYSKFESVKIMLPLPGMPESNLSFVVTTSPGANLTNQNSLHKHWQKLTGNSGGVPIGSRVFVMLGSVPTNFNIDDNLVMTGTGSGTAWFKNVFVIDSTNNKLVHASVYAAGDNTIQSVDLPNAYIKSPKHSFGHVRNEEVISDPFSSSSFATTGAAQFYLWVDGGELSISDPQINGGAWSAWIADMDESNAYENPDHDVLFRIKTTSPSSRFGVKTVTFNDAYGNFAAIPWYVGNSEPSHLFKPDFSLSSKEQVAALINHDNNSSLAAEKLSFGAITGSGENITVAVNGTESSGYTGTVNVDYRRVELEEFNSYGNAVLTFNTPTPSLADVISAFNSFYQTNLTADDYSNVSAPGTLDYVGSTFTLVAKSTSYAYWGDIDVTVKRASVNLGTVMVNLNLIGLQWPVRL